MVESVPENMRAAYHWINVGVDPDANSANNPFNLILNHYNAHDIVVVKLDIDNSKIELEFVRQLLQDERFHVTANGIASNNTDGASSSSSALIDHFYFEHHLGGPHERTESIQLFTKLREKGIPAHYWV
mmetsp:Transcript_25821/g.54573  ORF Transcript_25821/g.54573 Transcript_25821/m.54573 type:complete len:129 (+) Transcript_25821:401-787(+)